MLSPEEVLRLLDAAPGPKYKAASALPAAGWMFPGHDRISPMTTVSSIASARWLPDWLRCPRVAPHTLRHSFAEYVVTRIDLAQLSEVHLGNSNSLRTAAMIGLAGGLTRRIDLDSSGRTRPIATGVAHIDPIVKKPIECEAVHRLAGEIELGSAYELPIASAR